MVLAGLATGVAAQSLPWREAPIIEPHQVIPRAPPPPPAPTVESITQTFLDACVRNEGQATAVIDWALMHGFEPLDPLRADAGELLGGAAGTALAAPGGGGRVMLAAMQDGRCVLWAERTPGPPLRNAFQAMVGSLSAKGAKVQIIASRNLSAGETWRHQAQWRYRRVGGSQDFGLGSATTLADAPGSQLLHFAPMDLPSAPDPDGVARR